MHCSPVVKLEEDALSPLNAKKSGNRPAQGVLGGQRVNFEKRVPLKLALKLISQLSAPQGRRAAAISPRTLALHPPGDAPEPRPIHPASTQTSGPLSPKMV